jgi:ribosomal protein L11 methylase PrmA
VFLIRLGGFKIWECTFDLLGYLDTHQNENCIGPGSKILDLGCGSGLLGLYALRKGAESVVFQDYVSMS